MRTNCAFLLTAVCLSAPLLRAAEGEAPKPEVELRVYDVTTLIAGARDYPGPDLHIATAAALDPGANAAEQAPAAQATAASVADMIRNRVDPNSWDPTKGTSLEERAGVLVVMQTRPIHAKIAALLDTFGKDAGKQLAVQGLLVRASAEALPGFLGRAGKTVTDEAVQALLKANEPLAMPQLLVPNGARCHLFSGTVRSYVGGADVSGDILDPVVRQAMEGLAMDVRPTLDDEGREANVELRLTINADLKIETGSSPKAAAPAAGGDGEKPEMAKPADARMDLQRAAAQTRKVRETVQVPVGRWVLCAILTPGGASGTATANGADLLLLLVNAP